MSNRREFLRTLAGTATGIVFVGCGLVDVAAGLQQSAGGRKRREILVGGRRALTIDVHSHCYVDVSDLIKDHEAGKPGGSRAFQAPILSPTGVDARLQHMDEHGIDIQAVSLVPSYNYWAERDLAREIVKRQNEQIAAMCAAHPDRFVGLGTVALQHPDLAVEQMDQAVKQLGMRGFEIACNVDGEDLSAPKYSPFWAKAEELGFPVFMHPVGASAGQQQLQGNGNLNNVIGHPLETTVALSHLIFEGTLDRYPTLKICAAHGGGYLASYLGRSNHCAEASENCKPVGKRPGEYFKQQIYCDSIVFTPEGLRHLVAEVGADHVLLGTDFPFDIGTPHMGDVHAADLVLETPGLNDSDKRAILGDTAAKLFKVAK
jgi:aminocarboxymuconate-semialdehyde decarboxylase